MTFTLENLAQNWNLDRGQKVEIRARDTEIFKELFVREKTQLAAFSGVPVIEDKAVPAGIIAVWIGGKLRHLLADKAASEREVDQYRQNARFMELANTGGAAIV